MACSLCKKIYNKLLKLRDKFLDTKLFNVVKNVLSVQSVVLPANFLICNECALALLQAEIILKRLRVVILKDENAFSSSTKQDRRSGRKDHTDEENEKDFGINTLLSDWTFFCTHCEYTSNKSKWYKRHLITKHQLKNPPIYHCPYCNESYQRLVGIKLHLDLHGNKPHPTRMRRKTQQSNNNSINDSEISENSQDATFLHDNQMGRASEPDIFECSLCDYECADTQVLKTHLKIKHCVEDAKIYKCKKCPLRFVRKTALDNHIACKHDEKRKRRQSTQKRKSLPHCSTILSEEIEINDVKEEASDAETEVHLKCSQCNFEPEGINELKRHHEAPHPIADTANEYVAFKDTLADDKSESQEERKTATQRVYREQPLEKIAIEAQNGDMTENNKKAVMVTIPITVALNHDDNTIKDGSSSSTFKELQDTRSGEPTIVPKEDMTQSHIAENSAQILLNKLGLQSNFEVDKSSSINTFPKFQDTQQQEHEINAQNGDTTQSDIDKNSSQTSQKEVCSKLSLGPTLGEIPNADIYSDKQSMDNFFLTPQNLSPHQMNVKLTSKNDWVFICSQCNFEFKQRKEYKEHIKNEHDLNDENIYKCLYCTAAFGYYKSLKGHVTMMHSIHLSSKYETPATYSNSSQDNDKLETLRLRKRKNSFEINKKGYSSPDTESSPSKQLAKRKHVLSCVICGKIFSSAEKLQNHLNKYHSADEMCQ
ncbi:zinc finger protein 521-like isoform X2 [Eurosta solidaginis]|uniref:zinc finger protein 521-like isoform X2 n=1 Tax=Eurosta solidaginis TaxID=178769 RepID=UPI0035316C4E